MAWDQLLHSDADGNTLALVNTPTLFYDYMDPAQQHKETMDDFDFICNEVMDYGVLITKAGVYKDINEFMEAAKAEGGLTVADVGANGNKHLATVQMGMLNPDVTLTPVHQSGYSDNTAALLGGTVDAVSAVYGDIAATLADGEFDVLCVFNNERIDVLPDVPTFEEAGYGAVYEQVTRGYMMPKGVDPAMKEAIVAAFKEAIAMEDHLKELESLGLIEAYMDGDEYINFLKSQAADVEALAPELGWK
jgi:tripartite-type tricarboxylate transporter receptor subunit TctC